MTKEHSLYNPGGIQMIKDHSIEVLVILSEDVNVVPVNLVEDATMGQIQNNRKRYHIQDQE